MSGCSCGVPMAAGALPLASALWRPRPAAAFQPPPPPALLHRRPSTSRRTSGGVNGHVPRGGVALAPEAGGGAVDGGAVDGGARALEDLCAAELSENDCWEEARDLELLSRPYTSALLREMGQEELGEFLDGLDGSGRDPLWEQVKLEAQSALGSEPQAGPQLYSLILSQPSLLEAIATIVANEIETELMPATSLKNLFLEQLHPTLDHRSVSLDVMAAALRSPSVGSALNAILFDRGIHALVCYRVGHRLWLAGRKSLAYYMQSTVSSKYSADIHPAAELGDGIYLHCGSGVVIGETAVVGNDATILQGVTLGGTGKEAGDRHPKIGRGVILHDSATVLGNIPVGDGAVVTAKSIVTKPVPPLARVSGVPAKIRSYRKSCHSYLYPDEGAHVVSLNEEGVEEEASLELEEREPLFLTEMESLERRLRSMYLRQWESVIPLVPKDQN